MKDAENYDLASTHRTQMLLEMLVLNKPEEILCHSFSRALAQGHMVGICLVAIIVFFHLLLLFYGVVCTFAYGLALITYASCGASGVLCSSTIYGQRSHRCNFLCDFHRVCSFLRWQGKLNQMLHHDAIRRERTELGSKVFGCLHKLPRRALCCDAQLLQSSSLKNPFL
jgi:hypothetical protein